MERPTTTILVERRKARGGFTLLEVTLVVAIVGVMALMAAPRFNNSLCRARARQAAMRMVADLSLAQARASALSASQTFIFTKDPATYEIDGMMDPDNTAKQYLVDLSGHPYQVRFDAVDFGGVSELVYNGFGYPSAGGTIVIEAGSVKVTVAVDADTGAASFK